MTDNKRKSQYLPPARIGVVGAGSWGTAIAHLLATKGYDIDLWAWEPEVKKEIEVHRENRVFLPGVILPEKITPTNSMKKAVAEKDIVLVVVPSHVMRSCTIEMAPHLSRRTILVTASKGIEMETNLTMAGIIKEIIPRELECRLAVLSGPSFAKEVAGRQPTVITLASEDEKAAEFVQKVMFTPYFRVYTHDDVIGTELGGAVKNVIAIAAGIIDGMGLGLNTRAALITRGMTEIRRLGLKMGANPRTFTGLAGIGDLVLTCTGNLSRNYTLGKKIGQGLKLPDILKDMKMVAEGVRNARSIHDLSIKLDVEMPITREIYRILYEDASPRDALFRLMTRELKRELDEV